MTLVYVYGSGECEQLGKNHQFGPKLPSCQMDLMKGKRGLGWKFQYRSGMIQTDYFFFYRSRR